MKVFYNTKQIHIYYSYISPDEFERVYDRTQQMQNLWQIKIKNHRTKYQLIAIFEITNTKIIGIQNSGYNK